MWENGRRGRYFSALLFFADLHFMFKSVQKQIRSIEKIHFRGNDSPDDCASFGATPRSGKNLRSEKQISEGARQKLSGNVWAG